MMDYKPVIAFAAFVAWLVMAGGPAPPVPPAPAPAACEDTGTNCASFSKYCTDGRYVPLLKLYCPKTCDYCPGDCKDKRKSCPIWKLNGFCNSTFYSQQDKEINCQKSCDLCPQAPATP